MTTLNRFFLAVSFLIGAATANAQSNYTTAIGVKFYPGALSVKHFISNKNAVEGLAYFYDRGFRITGLYEIHSNIESIDGLQWYVGPGVHFTSYNAKNFGGVGVGIDGVLGLDYKVKSAPLNFSLDWQPSFELGNQVSNRGFIGNWGGLGIRFTL